ncbi:hypothetical protein Emtol_1725 [Emticicia oligotrophica DSM 17448]|uniref:Uncharacterized protein n=1 Tax=Emticicia oligotrophica (strain DSM 17448 / CIP 109782 / MTCC 6937 / GPTSA100-15) TaxID=929562 RepID=A0ABN4AKW1_EMTOG|nr:hypothetical protein Emtol_1725 [Emticicia oligotrophica DSM 17448]
MNEIQLLENNLRNFLGMSKEAFKLSDFVLSK